MENIYKTIRQLAKMSQEQFAGEIGTTVLSINRWENGKAEPNRMSQRQLFRFCVDNGIELGEKIAEDKRYTGRSNRLILYHGSKEGITGKIAPISRDECDFGAGFYMGTDPLQSLTLISSQDAPKFYTVSMNLENLKILNLDIDLQWAMLIAFHRKEMEGVRGSKIYEKFARMTEGYDVVSGYIADDRMYTELARFFRGDISDKALLNCLSVLDLGKQYVAISPKACRQIKILKEEDLSPLELMLLNDMSAKRRKEGVRLADEVTKQFRRTGRFFDEIVGGLK